jgi:hypothetical protein
MTADVPRQPATRDIDIATVRALVRAGVLGPTHHRWREMCRVAADLDIRPQDAVYRVHDGIWADHTGFDYLVHHAQQTVGHNDDPITPADAIREAATR